MEFLDLTGLSDETRDNLCEAAYHLQCDPLPADFSGKNIGVVKGSLPDYVLDQYNVPRLNDVVWCDCCNAYVQKDNHYGWCPF